MYQYWFINFMYLSNRGKWVWDIWKLSVLTAFFSVNLKLFQKIVYFLKLIKKHTKQLEVFFFSQSVSILYNYGFLVYLESRGGQPMAQRPNPSLRSSFCITLQLRMGFTSLKGYKQINTSKEEYVTEIACGPQSLKYLVSGPLQKNFANL